MNTQPRNKRAATTSSDAVQVDGIRKVFGSAHGESVVAVDRISLQIPRGEVVAFLGPNGAGKSTTIDMLLGLSVPDEGSVAVLGTPPLQASETGRCAAVLQAGGLLPDVSVGGLVAMMATLYAGAQPQRCIERAELSGLVDRRISQCSGGEQQRVRFALALISEPEVLLLDEPTAGMDVTTRHHFWDAMRLEADAGRTVMFATHYLEEAENFANRIIVINRGQIIADGSVDQIRGTVRRHTVEADLDAESALAVAGAIGVHAKVAAPGRYRFEVEDTDRVVHELGQIPTAHNISIASASLDEVFMTLTDQEQR